MHMNPKSKKKLVWIIAAVTGIPGLYYLLRDPGGLFYHLQWLINGEIPSQTIPLWATILIFLLYLVFLLRPVSAYGLFKLRTWGKSLAIGTLCLDLIIRTIGFIHVWTYYDRHPEAMKLLEEFEKSIVSGQIQHVGYVSMIPSYIIAASCIIVVVLLLLLDFKQFEESVA